MDALTEVVAADDLVTGLMIGIQIKGGDSWFGEPKGDTGWVFRSDDDHLAFWLGYSLPVIVAFVNDKREAFWQAIIPETVTETKARFSVVVPCAQRFDGSALEPLLALAKKSGGPAGSAARALRRLAPAAVRPLRRAEDTDHLAAARVSKSTRANSPATARAGRGALVLHRPSLHGRGREGPGAGLVIGTFHDLSLGFFPG